jgi:DNA topoisomerase-1
MEILNGKYGPYITYKGSNFRIPKNVNPMSMTIEDCRKIIIESADKPAKKRFAGVGTGTGAGAGKGTGTGKGKGTGAGKKKKEA